MPDNQSLPLLPVIVGPTAVGKTEVGILVAEAIGGEIISADSRQIYSGMEIGTGAPSEADREPIKHHFVAESDPAGRVSAGEYSRMARERIAGLIARGRQPIVVGGSGLYVRALVDGLAPLPQANVALREEILAEVNRRGMPAMLSDLSKIDPDYAPMVGPKNRKRLVRALEVWRLTGRPFSSWHRQADTKGWCRPRFFGLSRPRPDLHSRIAERARKMIATGWLDEIRRLEVRFGGLNLLPPAITESLGYKQLIGFLRGEITLETATEATIVATRQFAKRQITWFRGDRRVEWNEQNGNNAAQPWAEWIVSELANQKVM